MRLPAALLLDSDGTLIDSEPLWERVETDLARELGGVLTPEVRDSLIGGPMDLTIRAMQDLASRPVDGAWIRERLVEGVRTELLREVPWMPGVADLLGRARGAGVPVALVTSAFRSIAEGVAAHAPGEGFDVVVAGDDVARQKPDPECYLTAARLLGVPVEDCLAVEDSPTGTRAAIASGAHTVVVGGNPRALALGPVAQVASLDDLRLDLDTPVAR